MVCLIILLIISGGVSLLYSLITPNPWFWFLWPVLGLLTTIILFFAYIYFIILPIFNKVDINNKARIAYSMHVTKFLLLAFGEIAKVEGKENLAKEPNVMYVANHKALIDPLSVYYATGRPCTFAGKKEVWTEMPYLAPVLNAFKVLRIDRENDRNTSKEIIRGIKMMKDGYSMAIFPEGGIKTREVEQMVSLKAGCYKLATKSNSVIQPIAIIGNSQLDKRKGKLKFVKVTIKVLPAIYPEDYADLNTHEIGHKVIDAVNACYPNEEKWEIESDEQIG